MYVKSSERGVVRIFYIDLPKEAVSRFTTQAGTGEWPVQYALGAKSLRASFVEVIDIRDLGQMTLSDYLSKAYDISGRDFDTIRPQLDILRGHVLVLPSQAFNQTEQELIVSPPLRWIVTLREPRDTPYGAQLRSDSARGVFKGQSGDARPFGGKAFWPVVIGIAALVGAVIAAKFMI